MYETRFGWREGLDGKGDVGVLYIGEIELWKLNEGDINSHCRSHSAWYVYILSTLLSHP